MRAEVIAIGDELTSGHRLDTNSQWLSQQLGDVGIRVLYHTTVADELEAIATVLNTALQRSDVIITSGGLGPTADDLTRQAIATATGRSLVLDQRVLDHIRDLFARRGRTMPESNTLQAHFPAGSHPLANPHGTAPGIHVEVGREGARDVDIFALPGVPAEMREMWSQSVAPALTARLGTGRRCIEHRLIRCFGAGESEIESMLPDLVRRGRQPTVGITASKATITLRVTAEGSAPRECAALIEPTVTTIYECLGNLIYGEGDEGLEDAVTCILSERGRSLATAEWGTAGLIAQWLGATVAGTGSYRGGIVVRDRTSLKKALGIDLHVERGQPLDHRLLVSNMAAAVLDLFQTDYALAIGPFPLGGNPQTPPKHVHFVLLGPHGITADSAVFAAHPAIQRDRCAKQALNLLRLTLLDRRS